MGHQASTHGFLPCRPLRVRSWTVWGDRRAAPGGTGCLGGLGRLQGSRPPAVGSWPSPRTPRTCNPTWAPDYMNDYSVQLLSLKFIMLDFHINWTSTEGTVLTFWSVEELATLSSRVEISSSTEGTGWRLLQLTETAESFDRSEKNKTLNCEHRFEPRNIYIFSILYFIVVSLRSSDTLGKPTRILVVHLVNIHTSLLF